MRQKVADTNERAHREDAKDARYRAEVDHCSVDWERDRDEYRKEHHAKVQREDDLLQDAVIIDLSQGLIARLNEKDLKELIEEDYNRDEHGAYSQELEQVERSHVDHEEDHHQLSAKRVVVAATGNHGANIGNDLVCSE